MVSVDELRRLPSEERAELLRALIALSDEDPLEQPRYRRRRGLVLAFLVACCAWLIPWTVVLGFTLPQHYKAEQWGAAWIGFDVALTAAFAFTAFAVWRRLQIAILGQIITGTLLVCDAWFDVMLSWGSGEFIVSVATALLGELPLAVLMFVGARTLVLTTVRALWVREGRAGPVPRLREVRLVTIGRSVGGGF
ncbi:hypothetical protein [Actinomadura opuntiae]|uniref:hypothetical protein n=1 Tax=Actinomadura sp. OS1-43 TaxID=604315 RepID=UPI00255B22A4|nr:hypothetical protein [Actinomadura sp. OS1-43]MDL4815274.1 hypothetical protein [Actinomadura sp. OS1-43]